MSEFQTHKSLNFRQVWISGVQISDIYCITRITTFQKKIDGIFYSFNIKVANLPLVIKERDVRYQFSRIVLYRKLLQGYPFKRPLIWKEARIVSRLFYLQ